MLLENVIFFLIKKNSLAALYAYIFGENVAGGGEGKKTKTGGFRIRFSLSFKRNALLHV